MAEALRLPRALIAVEGPDALGFLDGLITQRLDGLAEGGARYAALLSPQGKLLADFFVWRMGAAALLLDVAQARVEGLMRRLSLYKLRAQVRMSLAEGLFVATGAGEGAAAACADPRLPALGVRAIRAGAAPPVDEAYQAQCIALGVPDPASDLDEEEAFGLEALLEELHGVDFHKGCFVGQENVSRMKRRATTRRKLCRVALESAVEPGAEITAGGVALGSLRSVAGPAGIAFLRLDRAIAAQARGEALLAGDQPLRLDPPEWMILPQAEEG